MELLQLYMGARWPTQWKRAGCPRDPECPSFKQMKEARKVLKREVRFTLFQQCQDLLVSVMDSSEYDTKLFHRLVSRQRAKSSTATETLQFNLLLVRRKLRQAFHPISRT